MTDATTPDDQVKKRSVRIAGHRTSISLEPAFWEELTAIAARRGLSISQLVGQIDGQRRGNLSSALRLFVLEEAKKVR